MNRLRNLLPLFVSLVCMILSSCGRDERQSLDVALLSRNTYVSVAQHTLVIPFVALEDYAYRQQSFSLDRNGDSERAQGATLEFLRHSADPKHPVKFDELSITVGTYGWNDSDMSQRQVCPLLDRKWAQSVCDNPWSAIQQALPSNRFRLVDLRRLEIGDKKNPINCINSDKPRREFPQRPGKAVMVCEAQVYGGDIDEFHNAVVRINGDLGALWMVSRHGQNGEAAEAMAEREGKAIVDFVQHGLGVRENFSALHDSMCRLRRPKSVDGPQGPDCLNQPVSHAYHGVR